MMFQAKTYLLLLGFLCLTLNLSKAQSVGINETGTAPNNKAVLDIQSSNKGLLIPRMTTANRNAMSSALGASEKGMLVYDLSLGKFYQWNGAGAWVAIGADDLGNHTATENFQLGTNWLSNDGDSEGVYINVDGNVGVGVIPEYPFQVGLGANVTEMIGIGGLNPNGASGNTSRWQSYTSTITGTTDKVRLRLSTNGGTVTLRIYEGEGTSGPLLGTTTFTRSNGWVDIPISVPQVSGQQYSIFMSSAMNLRFHSGNPYAGGRLSGVPNTDAAFEVYAYEQREPGIAVKSDGVMVNNYTLPLTDGSAGQVLVTDGSGVASWATPVDTDQQQLSLAGTTLSLTNSSSVNLNSLKDNLGSHTATENLQTNDNWISNDGGNEGMYIDAEGKVGVNTVPTEAFEVKSDGNRTSIQINSSGLSDGVNSANWQSFTATASGLLESIGIPFNGSSESAKTVRIYEGQGTGGAILFTTDGNFPGGDYATVYPNIEVTAGQLYTIWYNRGRGMLGGGGNPYPGGRANMSGAIDWRLRATIFDGVRVTVSENGLGINNYTLPLADGSTGQVMTTDGNGEASWTTLTNTDQQQLGFSGTTLSLTNSPSINLSALRDNLGNHQATQNLQLRGNWLSNDGGNEGIFIQNNGETRINNAEVGSWPNNTGFAYFGHQALNHSSNGNYALLQRNDGNTYLNAPSGRNINFRINNNDQMRLTSAGNFGIGRTNPAEKLHVNGNIQVGGSLPTLYLSKLGGGHYLRLIGGIMRIATPTSITFFESDTNTEVMRIDADNGRVGIGTTNPTQARLVVNGTTGNANYNVRRYNRNGSNNDNNSSYTYSIYASGNILATAFHATSDQRIKNIMGVSDSEEDLGTLMQVKVTDYQMKDQLQHGKQQYKKVIAQELAEVMPEAVQKNTTSIIPDIYQIATAQNGWITLDTDLAVGDTVQILVEEGAKLLPVLSTSKGKFQVEASEIADGEVFVYGRQVNDLHTVDYEALFMLNVSATQELAKRAAQSDKESAQLKSELEAVKAKLEAMQIMEARLQKIESILGVKAEK